MKKAMLMQYANPLAIW